jgi:hypothetical protein
MPVKEVTSAIVPINSAPKGKTTAAATPHGIRPEMPPTAALGMTHRSRLEKWRLQKPRRRYGAAARGRFSVERVGEFRVGRAASNFCSVSVQFILAKRYIYHPENSYYDYIVTSQL